MRECIEDHQYRHKKLACRYIQEHKSKWLGTKLTTMKVIILDVFVGRITIPKEDLEPYIKGELTSIVVYGLNLYCEFYGYTKFGRTNSVFKTDTMIQMVSDLYDTLYADVQKQLKAKDLDTPEKIAIELVGLQKHPVCRAWRQHRRPCGPVGHDMFCACGCAADDIYCM